MKIEILGPGCAKCKTLAANAEDAVAELGLDCEIEKVTSIDEIVKRGVLMTPAVVIDGKLKTVGKVASVKEIRDLLSAGSQEQPQHGPNGGAP
jgi:small redox-active disulfide protein 2